MGKERSGGGTLAPHRLGYLSARATTTVSRTIAAQLSPPATALVRLDPASDASKERADHARDRSIDQGERRRATHHAEHAASDASVTSLDKANDVYHLH